MVKRPKNKQSLKQKPKKDMPKEYRYTIYTDGSSVSKSNMLYGGSAYIVIDNKTNKVVKEWSKGYKLCTNNQLEIHSIVMAIESLPDYSTALIFSDSMYAITVLSQPDRTFPKNMEFIEQYRYIQKQKHIFVRFQWIKSHSGDIFNEKADFLARQAMHDIEANG